MLSDTLLTSIIGYVAGMMFNPNNVTPEAAPVTVSMEIEACNLILKMLGFNPPPEIPKELDNESAIRTYKKKLEAQFGWAHLTLGGTTANLEALWVARTVKYFPLAIWDIARKEDLSIEVKFPNGKSAEDIRNLTARQLLAIRPNESIYLLAKYVHSYRSQHGIAIGDASEKALDLLKTSLYHLSHGVGKVYQEFPPVIFVSGTAHYSLHKAVDILGIGRGNIQFVNMDSAFRMDVSDLEKKIQYALAENKIPLAVVAIVGTTEEGAVDPVHKVTDLRDKFEQQHNLSFWVHIDAAWGGYFRSLFNLSPEDEANAVLRKVSHHLEMEFTTIQSWHKGFFDHLGQQIDNDTAQSENVEDAKAGQRKRESVDEKRGRISIQEKQLLAHLQNNNLEEYIKALRKLVHEHGDLGLDASDFEPSLEDKINIVNEYVSDTIPLHFGRYSSDVAVRWGSKEVCSALVGISKADSITVDPHKMGYMNYPCGLVAFRNDRVRHFILQKAPYITSVRQDILVHMPPKHVTGLEQDPKTMIEAFAPFIVEGSRPGAAASALWLTLKTVPLTMKESGLIVKASVLAAREFYEWLVHWRKITEYNQTDTDYQFVPYTLYPPDTNLVIFGVKKKSSYSLSKDE